MRALLVCGCAASTPSDQSGNRVFSFEHEGLAYEIYSLDLPAGAPLNVLLRRAPDQRVVLRAKDVDQDGTIDTVLVGELSLAAANAVYRAGIAEAQNRGRYTRRLPADVFRVAADSGYYAVQTFVLDMDRSYNSFVIHDAARQETSILIDTDADGVLDAAQRGSARPDDAQSLYEAVLREGIEAGRIRRDGGRVVVQPGPA